MDNPTPAQPAPPQNKSQKKTIIIVVVIALVLVLFLCIILFAVPLFLFVSNSTRGSGPSPTPSIATITPTVITSEGAITVHGRIYGSGIQYEETPLLKGLNSDYQITYLSDNTNKIDGQTVQGFFLVNNSVAISQYAGKCVSLTGTPYSDWANANPEDTYFRSALVPVSVTTATDCADYMSNQPLEVTVTPGVAQFTLSGVLSVKDRPAPDINYDYYLQLDTPRIDNENASGMPQTVTSQVISPVSKAVFDKFVQLQGKHVEIKGFLSWGYAESTYISVQSIQEK